MGAHTLTAATYGQGWAFYQYKKTSTDTTQLLYTELSDAIVICGNLKEDGICFKNALTAPTGTATYIWGAADTTFASTTLLGTSASGILSIKGPAGGLGQFRGLSQDATADLYVSTICKGIAPYYSATTGYPKNLSGGTDTGFVIQCYTGIGQCVHSLADGFTQLTAT